MSIAEINTLRQLAKEIGLSDSIEGRHLAKAIGKTLFKSTRCGIVFNLIDDGISVCGYAEGADAECTPIELKYPFLIDAFWIAIQNADDEGCELWEEWNQ